MYRVARGGAWRGNGELAVVERCSEEYKLGRHDAVSPLLFCVVAVNAVLNLNTLSTRLWTMVLPTCIDGVASHGTALLTGIASFHEH